MAAVVKDHMLIHGGLDSKNIYLSDLAVLHLEKLEWKICKTGGSKIPPLAYHACVAILSKS